MVIMGDFTPEQEELILKNNLNPEHWYLFSETKKYLILLNRRGQRRTLKKEVLNNDA